MTWTRFGELAEGQHAIDDNGTALIVDVSAAGWTEIPADPPPRTIWPYDFIALLTDAQLVAIQTSTAAPLIRMRTKVQTLVSPMAFDSTSELYQGVQLLGQVMPDIFPANEITRILNGATP